MYNGIKMPEGNWMRKYVPLIISLLFLSSCDNKQTENNPLNTTTNPSSSSNTSSDVSNHGYKALYTNYDEAFKVAKAENKAVFILFSTEYCRWCTKLKETTLKNPEVLSRLNAEYVVLFLDRDKSKYPSKYHVKGVPDVYLTDKNEEIFTSMVGYHKNPNDYIKWFNYIQIELGN